MNKVFSNLCFLFLLLLISSCAKDNELNPSVENTAPVQALTGEEINPCDDPCQPPGSIDVTNISGCSATVSWTFEIETCGSFMIQLQNLSTGTWTFYNVVGNPFLLTNLDACTQYKVGVSHVTSQCASAPLQTTFQTDCRICKESCATPCQPVDFLEVINIARRTATVQFGHEAPLCGH